ncbi:MBG domain-containing protein [Slackia isoflavoniconvertens]|uniref:MBG domain-containing protein n=1 Tax=Slackia isoflavoniconvertens TaxID=572010 RepID=UPI003AACBEA2
MKKTKRFAKNLLAISLSICLSFMSVPFGTAFASDASGEISNAASAVLESDSNVAADSADVIADAVSTPEDSESSALERANGEPESLDGIISSDEEISSAASIDSIVDDTESENGDSLADKPVEPYEVELTAMGMLGANTVKISVPAADAGDELRAALGSATATLDPGSADDAAHASAKAALEAKFDGIGAFEAYSLRIVSGGQEVELPASAEVELTFVRLTADAGVAMPGFMNLGMSPRYFGLAGGELSELSVSASEQASEMAWLDTFRLDPSLPTLVAANGDSLADKPEGLKAGSYSITANLYVIGEDAPIGQNAYMTTTVFPPIVPNSDNANLRVDEDGAMTLTFYPVNEIFTLQDIKGNDDEGVHILSVERGGASTSYGSHSDRITKVVAKLDGAKSTYALGACTQCPTIFMGGADQHWRMQLDVDFDSAKENGAVQPGEDAFSKTFSDEATGITVAVSTSDKNEVQKIESARLSVVKHEDDEANAAIEAEFAKSFLGTPKYEAYSIVLVDADGNAIHLAASSVLVTAPSAINYVDAYKYVGTDGGLQSIASFYQQGNVIIQDSGLGTYVIADHYSADHWVDFDFANDAIGASGQMKISSAQTGIEGFKDVLTFFLGKEASDNGEDAYTLAIMHDNIDGETQPLWFWLGDGNGYLNLTIPVSSESDSVYLVESDGTSTGARKLDSTYADGKAAFSIVTPDQGGMNKDEIGKLLVALANGYSNGIASASADAPVAYIKVIHDASKLADKPYVYSNLAYSNLIYNGDEQTCAYVDGNSQVVQGSIIQKNAGSYSAMVEPKPGYTWFDGSRNSIELTWSIWKASLQISIDDLAYGAQSDFVAKVTGFQGSDTADSIGLKSVSLKPQYWPDTTKPGLYHLSNWDYWDGLDQGLDNYDINFSNASLYVGMAPSSEPQVADGLVYSGQEQVGVTGDESLYTLENVSQVDAGEYEAVAKLIRGAGRWSDGSGDDKVIKWSIAPATLAASYSGDQVTTARSEAKGEVSVSGFVNGETAETVEGFELPTVSIPEALDPGESYQLTPTGGNAGKNYQFEYAPGTLSVASSYVREKLAPGTYTITANLMMPGEYNPVLRGTTVCANTPDNPFADSAGNSPVVDENSDVTIANAVPTDAQAMTSNATLIVAEDGTKTLVLPVRNPCFTLQELGTCAELQDVKVERTTPEDPSLWNYGKMSSRIHKVAFTLTDNLASGERSYDFAGSFLYAVPLEKGMQYGSGNPEIRPSGDVALRLTVDYSSVRKSSDSTEVPTLVDLVDKGNNGNGGNGGSGNNNGSNGSQNNSGSNESNGSANGGSNGGIATTDGHLAAGTYTVSGNVWLPKSQTGLPLNPHLSNGGFPPSSPVSSNATLVVDGSGHAYVRIPVTIQDKVMVVNNVWGSGVSFDGSTITIDLGTPSAGQTTFTGTCQVSVTIGWLAKTIAAGIFNGVWDHTWTANWEVDLGSVLPASGGGTLPAAAQAILNGANGVAAEESAAEAALAALDENGSSASESAAAKKAGSQAASDEGDAADGGMAPVTVACIALGVVAVVAIAAWLLLSRKKRSAAAEAGANSANGE